MMDVVVQIWPILAIMAALVIVLLIPDKKDKK